MTNKRALALAKQYIGKKNNRPEAVAFFNTNLPSQTSTKKDDSNLAKTGLWTYESSTSTTTAHRTLIGGSASGSRSTNQRRRETGRANGVPTCDDFAVEAHVDGVDGGLVRHERGQEALVAQLAHVTRHVTAVDQDLQVARAGRRAVDCDFNSFPLQFLFLSLLFFIGSFHSLLFFFCFLVDAGVDPLKGAGGGGGPRWMFLFVFSHAYFEFR